MADRYNDLAILAGRRGDAGLAEERILPAIEIYRRARDGGIGTELAL